MRSRALGVAVPLLICGSTLPAAAQDAIAQFYKGKTMSIVLATEPGGPYDTYARLLARQLPKHLPGEPGVIINSMPGAGGETAATHVARNAPKDGTVMAAAYVSQPFNAILSDVAPTYDHRKLNYLGSATSETAVCFVRPGAPVTRFEDMFKTQVVMGGSAPNTPSGYHSTILNNVLGTKFKVVLGYPGTPSIHAAVLKGEVDGQCGLGWLVMKAQYGSQIASKEILLTAQLSENGHPELNAMGLPKVMDFAKDEHAKGILRIIYAQQMFARPYFVAAEVPAERVAALRRAFMAAWNDPELRKDAAKMKLDVAPVGSDEMAAVLGKVYASSPDMLKAARAAVSPPKK